MYVTFEVELYMDMSGEGTHRLLMSEVELSEGHV